MKKNYFHLLENIVKKHFLILSLCLLAFFITSNCANAAYLEGGDTILNNQINETKMPVLFESNLLLSQDNLVPTLATQTLVSFRKDISIWITKNNDLQDNGQADIGRAERRDYGGLKKDECIVSFNEESVAFKNTTDKNIFVKMNISKETIKEFVFLHEFAHCHDGDLNPDGIDSIEWREALADGYAMATLLDNHLISDYKINTFKKERKKCNAVGSVLILNKIVEFYESDVKPFHLTPVERLNKIKELRKAVFLGNNT